MAEKSGDATEQALFDDFRKIYDFYLPDFHKNYYSPDDLSHFLRDRYDYFRQKDEEVKIRVYNPAPEYWGLV